MQQRRGHDNRPSAQQGPMRPNETPNKGGGTDAGQKSIADLLRPPSQTVVYFTANDRRTVRPALVGAEAEEVAKNFATLPASQLRRFYADVMALKRRIEHGAATDDEVVSRMMLLRAKAAYTRARQKSYPDELVTFFTRHAAAVKGREDFLRGFQPHFEAVMAFHKVFERKKDDDR